jgi:hypothetical protein
VNKKIRTARRKEPSYAAERTLVSEHGSDKHHDNSGGSADGARSAVHGSACNLGERRNGPEISRVRETTTNIAYDSCRHRRYCIAAAISADHFDAQQWRELELRIQEANEEISAIATAGESCRRLQTIPGVGPLIATAMVAAIGNGSAFGKGRHFSAWLGLVRRCAPSGFLRHRAGTRVWL